MVTPNGSLKDNYHATSQETEGFSRKSDSFFISFPGGKLFLENFPPPFVGSVVEQMVGDKSMMFV